MPVSLNGDQVLKLENLRLPIPIIAPVGSYTLIAAAVRGGEMIFVDTVKFQVYRYYFAPSQ